jgi:hypothetical protein
VRAFDALGGGVEEQTDVFVGERVVDPASLSSCVQTRWARSSLGACETADSLTAVQSRSLTQTAS